MVLDPAADSGAFLLTCARMLAERAWSRSMIGDFLRNPDEQRPDPKSPRVGFPFRLYRAEHVFHVGATAAFAERVVIAARRAGQQPVRALVRSAGRALRRENHDRAGAWCCATCPTPEASGQASWSTGSTPDPATGSTWVAMAMR